MSAQGNVAEGGSSVPGSTQLGRYSLICEIAKAQFGALWAGVADGEMVLVRRIARASADVLALGKMMEAATALSGLEIAGFIEVKDVVGGAGEIGVVSEYREGEILRALLRHAVFKRSPLPPPVAVRVAVDILEALEAARDAEQVAFGCVWPDNILVGTDGQTRVMDLGISAIVGADGALGHHPELETYSAPERLADTPSADARSDVFAVGILLWEMIANQRLFSGTSAATAKQKVATAPIARLDTSKVGAPVGGPLADIVQRALERDPADRYSDTAALLAALKALGPEAVASPSEVTEVIEKLAGPVLGLRRRAIEKALARGAGGDQQTSRTPPVVARPTLEGVAPMAKGAAPAPAPLRGASATGTLLGVPSPAGVSLPQGSVVVSPPPAASRRPLPPPPKRSLRRTGALDESGDVHGLSSDPDSSGRHQSLDHLLEHVGGPKLAGSLDALTSKPPRVTESDKKAAPEPAAEPRVAKAEPGEPGAPLPSFEDEPQVDESAAATKRASPAPESPPKTMTVDSNRSASSPEATASPHTEEKKPLAAALAGISSVQARLMKSRAVVRGTELVKKHGGELLKNPKVVRGTELVKKRGAELMKNRTAVRAAIGGVGALLLIAIIVGVSRPKETGTETGAATSARAEPASSQAANAAAAPEPSAAPPPSAAAPPPESAAVAAPPPPAPPKHAVTKSSSTFLGTAKKTSTSGKTTTTTAKSKSPTTTTTAKKKTTPTTTR